MLQHTQSRPRVGCGYNHIENEDAYYKAVKRNILENAKITWRKNTERANEIEDAICAGRKIDDFGRCIGYEDGFIGSMAAAFDQYGKLTPNQSGAIVRGIDARAARRAEWANKQALIDAKREHVGVVGQKASLTLVVKKIIEIEGYRGASYIHICEDQFQNIVIYKGTSNVFAVEEGATVIVTATVKDHGVRNGVKQTVIERPKAVVFK